MIQSLMRLFAFHFVLNALGKGMNPSILLAEFFSSLGKVTSLGEENSKFKPGVLHLKIDLVPHPALLCKGWLNTYRRTNVVTLAIFSVLLPILCCFFTTMLSHCHHE